MEEAYRRGVYGVYCGVAYTDPVGGAESGMLSLVTLPSKRRL